MMLLLSNIVSIILDVIIKILRPAEGPAVEVKRDDALYARIKKYRRM